MTIDDELKKLNAITKTRTWEYCDDSNSSEWQNTVCDIFFIPPDVEIDVKYKDGQISCGFRAETLQDWVRYHAADNIAQFRVPEQEKYVRQESEK